MKYRKTFLAAVALLALGSARAHAATFTVTNLDDNGAGSLRNAILLADIVSGADIVVFQAGLAGTIQLSADEGQIPILEDLEIVGPGPAALAVSGSQATRVFSISAGSTVSISGLTITQGNLTGLSFSERGAGILNAGDLSMENCILSENFAGTFGGGIASSGNLTASDCSFVRNSTHESDGIGGALLIESGTATLIHCDLFRNHNAVNNFEFGTVTLADCTFSENGGEGAGAIGNRGTMTLTTCTILNGHAENNGGIGNSGTITLTECRVAGNRAAKRAGGIGNSGTATLTRCTIFANFTTETGTGGGIYNFKTMVAESCTIAGNGSTRGGGIYNSGNLTLTNSTVNGNLASEAGGILNEVDRERVLVPLPTVIAANTTVSGNQAFEGGGFLNRSLTQLANCTFSGNRADSGAAFHNGDNGTLILGNTILANSGAGRNCHNIEGRITSLGHNLDSDGTCDLLEAGDQSGTLAVRLDPLLGPLQNNGGPTETHALLPGSPAIDAGDATLTSAVTDQRGFPRISDGNGDGTALIDIGAFELDFFDPSPFGGLAGRLLTYTTVRELNTRLPAGTQTFNLTLQYGVDIIPGTFVAKLNGQYLTGLFSPTPGGVQTVPIPLSPGQNFLSLRVKGKVNGRPAEDVDTLGFRVGDPPFGSR